LKYYNDLKNGVVLAEMAGKSNGRFCAEYGKGAALVMLGTYIIDKNDTIDYPRDFYFKPNEKYYYNYLKENIQMAKGSGAGVGVSALSVDIKDTVTFLKTAEQLGADYLSYCAHSVFKMFLDTNTSSALLKKRNWDNLRKIIYILRSGLSKPLILKIGAFDNKDVIESIDIIKEENIKLIHINVEDASKESKGYKTLKNLDKENTFFIAGGGIKNSFDALRVLETGVDAVSIASASLKDKHLCMNMAEKIKSRKF